MSEELAKNILRNVNHGLALLDIKNNDHSQLIDILLNIQTLAQQIESIKGNNDE